MASSAGTAVVAALQTGYSYVILSELLAGMSETRQEIDAVERDSTIAAPGQTSRGIEGTKERTPVAPAEESPTTTEAAAAPGDRREQRQRLALVEVALSPQQQQQQQQQVD